MDKPVQLLRIPEKFQTIEGVLETAKKMNLPNVLVLSELPNGNLVFLDSGMDLANANWLLDRLKFLLLSPDTHSRKV